MKPEAMHITTKFVALFRLVILIGIAGLTSLLSTAGVAQEKESAATVNTSIGSAGAGRIIIETHGHPPNLANFYTATARATVLVGADRVEQTIQLTVKVIQGDANRLSFGISGSGEVTEVEGNNLQSWSIRQEGDSRFLDLHLNKDADELTAAIKIRSAKLKLPVAIDLTHLTPGKTVGFDSMIGINFAPDVEGAVTVAKGFVPLDSGKGSKRFQTTTGGQLQLSLSRSDASPAPVELVETTLEGTMHADGKSISFKLLGTAHVTKANAEITILSGTAAVSHVPTGAKYRLRLSTQNDSPIYNLVFAKPGTFPVSLEFVTALVTPRANWHGIDFTIAASAVVPLTLNGFDSDLEFHRDQQSVVPLLGDNIWRGFLPATGRANLQWRNARQTGQGKLFFTTTGQIEATVGAGLLRQDHQIDYKVLQGALKALSIQVHGPGEILDVLGSNIVAWNVTGEGDNRQLDAILSQAITTASQIKIRSQTPLGPFPVRVEGLRLNPIGAVRHSGYLRLSNVGSVRLEPAGLSGLTQLAPDQFPGEPLKARQVFVYRFPAAVHDFEIAVDRIQPEVHVSELVLYQLSEADRMIKANIELDIREAPIREWDFGIPSDYSVVSVAGASVADYIVASEVTDGRRNLKVVFSQDVAGHQLVSLQLEKSEPVAAGDWVLHRLEYPGAKTVRGNVGIVGAPGFRIAVGKTDLLVEKPLSYFPIPTANLQQAFRIREPGWSATMQIELLDRSVQSDVFHLYSLSEGTIYGSVLLNYFVTGAPVSEWQITVPKALGNVMIDGQDVRSWRREGDSLIVSLHQPVMGPYTLLVTFEEKPNENDGTFQVGQIAPIEAQSERGYIQVVSPMQVKIKTLSVSESLLKLDPLELPAEFRLLSSAPPLGTWQYTERPFDLNLKVSWFRPGTTVNQVVEFSEANSSVSQDGESVTDVLYYVKSRGQRMLKIKLPAPPVRLWEVSVGGRPVTVRQTDGTILIPLPGGTDPNIPVEVRLRLGKPTVDELNPVLTLPIVFAPVLKTQWHIRGDEKRVLVPSPGTLNPSEPVLRPSGFEWMAKRGIGALSIIALLTCIGVAACTQKGFLRLCGLTILSAAIFVAIATAMTAQRQTGLPALLQLSLPVLAAEEVVELHVKNMPLWLINLSWLGLAAVVGGVVAVFRSFLKMERGPKMLLRSAGLFLIALGTLGQRDGAPWFFALLAFALLVFFLAQARDLIVGIANRLGTKKEKTEEDIPGAEAGVATVLIFLSAMVLSSITSPCQAAVAGGFEAADSIVQQWQVYNKDKRLSASGTITLSGEPGDRFLLLKAPAILTQFKGDGLRLTKRNVPGQGLAYIISIPVTDKVVTPDDSTTAAANFTATFEFQLEALKPTEGVPVLTGIAAVQQIDLRYDEAGWDIGGPTVVRVEPVKDATGATRVKVLLGPGKASLVFTPKARDVTTEETQFFVEASNLYLPGPGVVDGRHRLHIRTSQGQVSELSVLVPQGLTVSRVTGPVGAWQFDADSGQLKLAMEPPQSQAFDVIIDTQRGLDTLPADISLAPLKVAGANGEVGLLAIAFGPDAQPEKAEPEPMSVVNLGDFGAGLIPNQQAVLHRVYRYGAEGGKLALRVAPVDSEVRVTSKQVLSLGDERVVLGVNFVAEISRAGLFQLSFPLPEGLEVESLTGAALHHWSELSEGDERQIILHLNGKTIGTQGFSLTLTGVAPTDAGDWTIPHFELTEAARQAGELVIKPTTGIRLRTVSRQNVSETDPRALGGQAQGSLAFRLLQRDWNLVLSIEKLDPWVTGQVLHEITLREGQTRTALIAKFNVQNASIRTMQVALPITNENEIKTLRASGKTVSDLIRTAPDSNIWEVQFKRRVVGKIQFRIEYERRGDRESENETLSPVGFPQARQLSYYYGVRVGGRLEIEHDVLSQGWQLADWNTVPQALRLAGTRTSPALTLRAIAPENVLKIHARRHSLADALKLRVAQGTLTTILSPTGDQLTAVDVTMEVIQRSSLSVGLPVGGELISVFVNGESVHSIRQEDDEKAWLFYILPGTDDRTAKVRFVYSVPGDQLRTLKLISPQLNVPLENIAWNVVAPKGFELTDHDGDLELKQEVYQQDYDRSSYLSKTIEKRKVQAQQAAQLLERANQLLQAGEQSKARWALNSVANQYALDAASNEDARVQLENLQTQQAVVGLNTRRQRLFLDNDRGDAVLTTNQQLLQAAAGNQILQLGQLNFRPQQISQLLQGNTTADNAVLQQIAGRLVQHQRTTEPAPQAITITLPEEGTVYTFSRSVQVSENAPLELDLRFGLQRQLPLGKTAIVVALLTVMVSMVVLTTRSRETPE